MVFPTGRNKDVAGGRSSGGKCPGVSSGHVGGGRARPGWSQFVLRIELFMFVSISFFSFPFHGLR